MTQAELETFEQATVAWPRDLQGYHFGGAFLKLPARDLAKLGYLYPNGGHWDGIQVVPADYVSASAQPQSDPGVLDYGYQWWVTDNYGYDSFRAQGYGGQIIQVISDLDLVVVITSDPDQENVKGSKVREVDLQGCSCAAPELGWGTVSGEGSHHGPERKVGGWGVCSRCLPGSRRESLSCWCGFSQTGWTVPSTASLSRSSV